MTTFGLLGPWLTVAGLVADLLGAAVIASGVFTSKDRAFRLASEVQPWFSDVIARSTPRSREMLRQSRLAKYGLALICVGFALQLIGALPKLPG